MSKSASEPTSVASSCHTKVPKGTAEVLASFHPYQELCTTLPMLSPAFCFPTLLPANQLTPICRIFQGAGEASPGEHEPS